MIQRRASLANVAFGARVWLLSIQLRRLTGVTVAATQTSAQTRVHLLFPIAKRRKVGAESGEEVMIDLVGDHLAASAPRHQACRGQGLEVGRHRILRDLQAARYLSGGQSVRLRQEERHRA